MKVKNSHVMGLGPKIVLRVHHVQPVVKSANTLKALVAATVVLDVVNVRCFCAARICTDKNVMVLVIVWTVAIVVHVMIVRRIK
jgi:hypothetical protein